jgi:hypothetical protein
MASQKKRLGKMEYPLPRRFFLQILLNEKLFRVVDEND